MKSDKRIKRLKALVQPNVDCGGGLVLVGVLSGSEAKVRVMGYAYSPSAIDIDGAYLWFEHKRTGRWECTKIEKDHDSILVDVIDAVAKSIIGTIGRIR